METKKPEAVALVVRVINDEGNHILLLADGEGMVKVAINVPTEHGQATAEKLGISILNTKKLKSWQNSEEVVSPTNGQNGGQKSKESIMSLEEESDFDEPIGKGFGLLTDN